MADTPEREPMVADRRPTPEPPRLLRANVVLGATAVLAIAVGALAWFLRQPPPPDVPVAAAPEPAATSAPPEPAPEQPPAVQHPIEPLQPEQAPPGPPALEQSDPWFRQALTELLGRKAVLSQLQLDGFVRRVVATVDSLPRAHAAPRVWPVNPTPERFAVVPQAGGEAISPDNALRYAALVQLVEAIDVQRAVALYAGAYPLFQQAYEELGYPNAYFNDRLVQVIDHLLAAPEPAWPVAVRLLDVKGPTALTRPWVHYEFVDPELEALSAGQKLMVRVGPENERRLKARLRAIRSAVTAAPPQR